MEVKKGVRKDNNSRDDELSSDFVEEIKVRKDNNSRDDELSSDFVEEIKGTAVGRVLKKRPLLFLNKQISVEKVEADEEEEQPCHTIEVHGFAENTGEDVLEMYFENTKRSGGGEVASVVIEYGVALVTFTDEKVASSVCERQHTLGGRKLKVSLHLPPKKSFAVKGEETELLGLKNHSTDVPNQFIAIKEDGSWKNVWKPWERPGLGKLWKWFRAEDKSNIPQNEKDLDSTLPLVTPRGNNENYRKLLEPITDGIQVMWIGHATVLVRFDGLTVLTDPIFTDRCNPIHPNLPIGTKRYRKAPCTVRHLPHIDAVIISHDHFDHLCHHTVQQLNGRYKDKITWFVPMDMKTWFTGSGCRNVVELKWWQSGELDVKGKKFQFISTPCQSWCRRGLLVENKSLWCSWVIKGPSQSFFFVGDTGYHKDLFQFIGECYGPFSCAAIPIGAYEPRWMMEYQHVNPEEAVKIHNDIKARYSVGIRWGTFHQTNEYYLEPREKIEKTLQPEHKGKFVTLQHGEVRLFRTSVQNTQA